MTNMAVSRSRVDEVTERLHEARAELDRLREENAALTKDRDHAIAVRDQRWEMAKQATQKLYATMAERDQLRSERDEALEAAICDSDEARGLQRAVEANARLRDFVQAVQDEFECVGLMPDGTHVDDCWHCGASKALERVP
jgi:hypothetical protein